MIKPIPLACRVAVCSLLLLVLQAKGSLLAGPCLEYPCKSGGICIPNANNYGYFRTVWRVWPGERRPDRTFPRSIGAEVVPTPEGQKQLPLPKAPVIPGGTPAEEGILPPEGGFKIEEGIPVVPEPPAFTPRLQPLLQGDLPGALEKPEGLPPLDPGSPDRLPGLRPDSDSPAPLEPPAEPPAEIPNDGAELPRAASQAVASGEVGRQGLGASEVSDNESSPKMLEAAELPRAAPQAVAGGEANRQGLDMPEASDQPPPKKPKARPLQANWMAALHPGFRGDAGRTIAGYPSMPVRPVLHQVVGEPKSTPAIRRADREQPDEQPSAHAKATLPPNGGARPPVALDGYCPVELGKNERWVRGDPRWSVVHQGRTYLFCGRTQRECFLADRDRYAPACSGHDPVLVVDGRRDVPGQTDYCVTYNGRLYMFSSLVTLARFQKNPERYAVSGE